ncbi:MAG: DNA-formamidopyrimidine glycosylase family protein [Micromonosporaceae bacterium]
MPEGDTVYRQARQLHRALAGTALTGSDFRVPRLATADLIGWTVVESVSRGKHLLLRTEAPDGRRLTLHSHLRMDGVWRIFAPGAPWRGRPSHQIRVVLSTPTATAVGFHVHDLALVATDEESGLVGHLGPDLLGEDWDPAEAVRRLSARPSREIAAAVTDQQAMAGIGNLYKCELLFLRGISPWTPVAEVPDLDELVALAHRLLVANRDRPTQATTGSLRRGETTWVYDRPRRPCRRCGTPIRSHRGTDRYDERTTYWCPTCQPGPAPS